MPSPVAQLRTLAPFPSGPFVVRGVVPCPTAWSSSSPISSDLVASFQGRPLATQVEGCRFDERNRIEAVEVSAVLPADLVGLQVGSAMSLDLSIGNASTPPVVGPPPGLIAESIASSDLSIHAAILDAAGKSWSYSAVVRANPVPQAGCRLFRAGPIVSTLEFYGRLQRRDPAAPFAELLGFSLWLTWTAGEDVVLATLSLNSGEHPNVLPDLDLVGLELQVPDGIELEHKAPELEALAPIDVANGWAHALLAPGKREVWLQRQERAWRFALFASGNRTRARTLLDNGGWAVAGPSPSGWSWSNRQLCGYLAQGVPAPSLAHLGVNQLGVPGSAAALAGLVDKLRTSAPIGSGNNSVGRLGLFHPWGCGYGGMTGGSEIDQLLGIELASGAPDPRHLSVYQLHALRVLDRHRIALYRDGRPLELDQFEDSQGRLPFFLFNYTTIAGKPDAPLGFVAARAHWTRPPNPPAHEATLRTYDPMDQQHQVRFTGPWKVLAALDRDPLAIRLLSLQAELVRGNLWEKTGGILAGTVASARNRPRMGGPLGRGEGWSCDSIAQSYTFRRAPWRRRFAGWVAAFFEAASLTPTPAGVWQRTYTGKAIEPPPFNKTVSTAQTIELGIVANALVGLWRAARSGDTSSDPVRALLEASSTGLRYVWAPGRTSAYQFVAIGPVQVGTDPFPSLPSGMWKGYDSFQVENLLGYGLELATVAGDANAVAMIKGLIADWTSNAPNPVVWMQGKGWANVYNRAALLSALQAGL
jgi:hypothetical protein